jgi:hypothetical protein
MYQTGSYPHYSKLLKSSLFNDDKYVIIYLMINKSSQKEIIKCMR